MEHSLLRYRFSLVVGVLLVVGGVLRVAPWRPATVPAGPGAQQGSSISPEAFPAGLEATILTFYDRVDRGQYAEAYPMVLEGAWRSDGSGTYSASGLAGEEEFVAGSAAEFGDNGTNITLFAIQVLSGTVLALPAAPISDPQRQPDLSVLNELPADLPAPTRLYQVALGGSLGDACTPWAWNKHLLVAGWDDGNWRILLSGGPRPGGLRKTEWFTDGDPFTPISPVGGG